MREIVGYAAPEDTREGLQRAIRNGASGMNVVDDLPTKWAVDPDHPLFRDDVGVEGVSVPTVRDCERLLEGVDLSKVDLAWHSISLVYPLTVAVHKKRGQSLDSLLGSHMPDYLHQVLSGWGAKLVPPNMALRMSADCIDFATENTPKWSLGVPQAYDLRERGVTPSQEIAVGMAIVQACLDEVVGRGRSIDDVAPKMAWVSTSDVDFFEEVAKFRALAPGVGADDEGPVRRHVRTRDEVADRCPHVRKVARLPAASEQPLTDGHPVVRGHLSAGSSRWRPAPTTSPSRSPRTRRRSWH